MLAQLPQEEFVGSIASSPIIPKFSPSLRWCADTGATSHMTPHRECFHSYEPYSVPIHVADGTTIKSAGIGTIMFKPRLPNGQQSRGLLFHRVLHVPDLKTNLLSVLYLTSRKGFQVVIKGLDMNFFS